MTTEERIALLEETFDTEEGTLSPDMLLTDVDEYDSMTKLALIVMMEDEFGKRIDSETIKKFETINDILLMMER